MRSEFSYLFDELCADFCPDLFQPRRSAVLKQQNGHDVVEVALPGIDPADVTVKFQDGVLLVGKTGDQAETICRVALDERQVDLDKITAQLRHGLLVVTLPRLERAVCTIQITV
jgi:HSP20 family molecular chaperone IbpA